MASRFGSASFPGGSNGHARGYGPSTPQTQRSTEAPMDYQWTNRRTPKPVWAAGGGGGDGDTSMGDDSPAVGLSTPRKRPHDVLAPSTPSLSGAPEPTFGSNQNVPFLFHRTPVPQTPVQYPWQPPSSARSYQPEVHDVDMNEASPLQGRGGERAAAAADYSPMKEDGARADERDHPPTTDDGAVVLADSKARQNGEVSRSSRQIAGGALRRVFKQRTSRRPYSRRRRHEGEDDGEASQSEDDDGSDDDDAVVPRLVQKTQNFINVHAPVPRNETPAVLLGYLQVSVIATVALIVLYLVLLFIINMQDEASRRIEELTQDVIQEIAMCGLQFRNNRCDIPDLVPALVSPCATWELCMNRDPLRSINRVRIYAEAIGDIFNGFFEVISLKTTALTVAWAFAAGCIINFIPSFLFAKPKSTPEYVPPAGGFYPLPPNAHHALANGSWGNMPYRPEEDMEAPARRRRLDGGVAAKVK